MCDESFYGKMTTVITVNSVAATRVAVALSGSLVLLAAAALLVN